MKQKFNDHELLIATIQVFENYVRRKERERKGLIQYLAKELGKDRFQLPHDILEESKSFPQDRSDVQQQILDQASINRRRKR